MKVLSLFLLILSMAILNACGESPVAEEPENTNTTTEVETAGLKGATHLNNPHHFIPLI